MTTWKDRFKVVPAVYVIFRRGDDVLLLKRANTDYFSGQYSVPAGHLEGNETAQAAAIREAHEEVGVVIDPADLKFIHVMHRVAEEANHERVDFFFEAMKWQGEPTNMEPNKCDDVAWFPLFQLPKNTIPVIKKALGKLDSGEYYSHENFESD